MPYRLRRSESVPAGIRRLVSEQIDRAVAEIDDETLDPHETVHQVRKRCKKVRGALRLVRFALDDTYRFENAWFRDAARDLSAVRTAESILETFDGLATQVSGDVDPAGASALRQALLARRDATAEGSAGLEERLVHFRERMQEARDRIAGWPLKDRGFEMLADGLRQTYRRGRTARKAAFRTPSPETLHEWRKRVKYHWYHVRLLRNIWKPVLTARRGELRDLSELLGDLHDAALLRHVLLTEERFADLPGVEPVVAAIDRRAIEMGRQADRIGRRVFAEKPKRLAARWRAYWTAWRSTKRQPVRDDGAPLLAER